MSMMRRILTTQPGKALSGGGRAFGLALALCFALPGAALLWPQGAQAQAAEGQVQSLNALTYLPETLEIMAQEGLIQGRDLGAEMFGNSDDPAWVLALARIFDAGRMQRLYDTALAEVLAQDPSLIADVTPFLSSELGRRTLGLELEARRTALDEIARGAAREVFAELEATDPARRAQIERLVLSADLIESNVIAGLNGNVAFIRGMAEAGAPGTRIDEGSLLAQVWSQQPQIRTDVADFLYPLMALAYASLSDDELEAYVLFAESAEGRRFNAALTKAFEPLMIDLSRNLGLEAGRLMSGQVL